MDVDAQKPSSKKAAPSSKPRATRAGTAGAAALLGLDEGIELAAEHA